MKHLWEAVRRKRSETWTKNTWMLHHDNAPGHTSLLVGEVLGKHEMSVVLQPPYCSDLAPADPTPPPRQFKSTLKGPRFQAVEEIEENL
jgi:hypothetical protein